MVGKWSQNNFLKQIKPGAIKAWQTHKILPSLVGAQAALESGWGVSFLATKGKNLFGIKASDDWKGRKGKYPTNEFINGKWVEVLADFREYDSWTDSIVDHASFFSSTPWRKDNYKAVVGEKNYKKAVAAILQPVAKASYATDPNYTSKIVNIVEQYGLTEWDQEAFKGDANMVTPISSKKYDVKTSISGYVTATDAKNKKNPKSTVGVGSYFIYSESEGMVNVTKTNGSPGSWINPIDNKSPKVEEKSIRIENFREAKVYSEPSFKSKVVNAKKKDSSIKVFNYVYGEADSTGNNVWLLIDKGLPTEGYVHDNNFLGIRRNEVYQLPKK